MTLHLYFPLTRYEPTPHAAEFEVRLAEAQCDAIRDTPIDERGNCVPPEEIERFRAARERLLVARDIYTNARRESWKRRTGNI